MPTARIDASLELHDLIDDCTDPWREAETILLLHNNAESGLPGYEVRTWNGVAVRAGTPRAIIERLNKEIHAAVNSPPVSQRFHELGVEPNLMTPEAMHKMLVAEIAKWNSVIDKANIPRQ